MVTDTMIDTTETDSTIMEMRKMAVVGGSSGLTEDQTVDQWM